jgi:hypothetical protein
MPYNYQFIQRSNNQTMSLDDINDEIKELFNQTNKPEHWVINC